MRSRAGFLCLAAMLLIPCVSAPAVDRASVERQFEAAIGLWRQGDTAGAREQLTAMIEAGSEDPRVYYYRGILDESLGKDGAADFKAGAKLEAEGSAGTKVNRALERTQGLVRAKIERSRAEARNALKADPETARQKLVYREALDARSRGDLPLALKKLGQITETGRDPRYFYMLGVTLAETGDMEKARAAFTDGLSLEMTPQDTQLVNIALADVQGELRRLIEEETTIEAGAGGQLITRQSNARELQRRALMTQDQLLAEANAETVAAAERERAAAEARRLAAAEAIIAENKARQEMESRVFALPGPASPQTQEKEEMPAETATVAATDAPSPAPDPDAPVNPFLGGAASVPMAAAGPSVAPVSSVTDGPIDTSWLPLATEYLMYARPADILQSGFMKPLAETTEFQDAVSEMSAQTGIAPADIESVTMGMGNIVATMLPIMSQMAAGPPDQAAITKQLMGGQNVMIVIRTTTEMDASVLGRASGGTESSHSGKTYFLVPMTDANQPQMALYLADAKTVLYSSEPGIKAAISGGPLSPENEMFSFVSRRNHMVQAFASPLLAAMSAGIPDPQNAPPQVVQLVRAVKGKISGFAVTMNAGSDLGLDITLNLLEDSAATEANTALAGGLMMAKQMAPFALAQAPQPLQPSLNAAVNSLASSANGTRVTASMNIPGAIVQAIKDSPEMLGPFVAARSAAQRVEQNNNLKQVALSMHNYHSTFGSFPAADGNGLADPEKKTGLSWRVHLLPFLEEAALYNEFHLDEPWDSDHNKTLIARMPEVFRVAGIETPGETTIHVFVGAMTPFDPSKPRGPALNTIIDGTSNTIMAVVAGPETATPWTQPGGLPFDAAAPMTAMGTLAESFAAVLFDGSVRQISSQIAPQTFSHLIQHQDGNAINGF